MEYSFTTLSNGLRLITVPMASVKSAMVLVLSDTGSRYEQTGQQGIAHFFEHMVFKGTKSYPDAQTLAVAIDAIGADFNAFTSKEYTGYYVHAASEHVDLALDVVSDMLLTPTLRQEDIDREKGVIIEELNMYVDSPPRHIANKFDQMVFRGSGLEHDIIGTKETVKSLTTQDFNDFLTQWYDLSNLILVVVGDESVVKTAKLEKKIMAAFGKKHASRDAVKHHAKVDLERNVFSEDRLYVEHRATEQAHFVLGWPAIKRGDDRRYALGLLNAIMGANMSSRLFSEVREKRGLCYYVRTDVDQYHDAGVFGAAAGVDPSRVEEALQVTLDEFKAVANGSRPITTQELQRAKDYIAGKLILGLEDPASVAQYVGMKQLLLDEIKTPEQVLEAYNKTTLQEVQTIAQEVLKPDQVRLALIGPYKNNAPFEALINRK